MATLVTTTDKPTALLVGLSEDLASEIRHSLLQLCSAITSTDLLENIAESGTEVIFCTADFRLVSRLRQAHPEAPIVVVSRHAEVTDWLDSIEAGATDYCAAPFEPTQVKWILESSRRSVVPLPRS